MKKIIVAYYASTKLPDLPYKHNDEFPFSKRKRNQIIDKIMDSDYNVMLQRVTTNEGHSLIIWIDKYRFQQR